MMILYFDGGSRGNPGKAGAGSVIYDSQGNEVYIGVVPISGIQTNNYAEYMGLIDGLKGAISLGVQELLVRGDSQLVIRQILGEYKVKSRNITPLYKEAMKLLESIPRVQFEHVPRRENIRADELSNYAM